MKKLIVKLFNRIRGIRDLDNVLGKLSTPLRQLEELQEQHRAMVASQEAKIAKLTADNAVKAAAIARAAQVHTNISNLFAIPTVQSTPAAQ